MISYGVLHLFARLLPSLLVPSSPSPYESMYGKDPRVSCGPKSL
jgi:hypothetical protein